MREYMHCRMLHSGWFAGATGPSCRSTSAGGKRRHRCMIFFVRHGMIHMTSSVICLRLPNDFINWLAGATGAACRVRSHAASTNHQASHQCDIFFLPRPPLFLPKMGIMENLGIRFFMDLGWSGRNYRAVQACREYTHASTKSMRYVFFCVRVRG